MSRKTLCLLLAVLAIACFALPFVAAPELNISGFSAAFGSSYLGYSINGLNILVIGALLLALGAVVLAFTKKDLLCPLFSALAAVLLLCFRSFSIEGISSQLNSLFGTASVSGGLGLYLSILLLALSAGLYSTRKKSEVSDKKEVLPHEKTK